MRRSRTSPATRRCPRSSSCAMIRPASRRWRTRSRRAISSCSRCDGDGFHQHCVMPRESGASSNHRASRVAHDRPMHRSVVTGSPAFADDDGADCDRRGEIAMTIALPTARPAVRRLIPFDVSWPILIGVAVVLVVLIALPMSWLVYFSLTDRDGALTLANFRELVVNPVFVEPFITTVVLATSSAAICCAVAAPIGWLVARTDMPLRGIVRALVTASFVTPPFLGAIAWELLAAPNSGLLNQLFRAVTGAPQDEYLFNIYSLGGLIFVISCYTFPYVFVLLANALDRIPGDLEDASSILGGSAWTTARRVTIPLAMPALLAGALVAFLQAMTLFGSPAILAIPAGFHTMTTKIWSLFQYPPKPQLAAAASMPLLLLTILLLRAESFLLGRRGYAVVGGRQGNPRLVGLGPWKWVALGVVFLVPCCPVFLRYGALLNAAFAPVASQFVTPATATLHNIKFALFEVSATSLAFKNTMILCTLTATIGAALAVVIAYVTTRRVIAGWRALE